ncbi:MAG TPA: hypothetical protein PKE39_13265 [Ignavibacteria bacterium]|nr:hypothetical protein [Ignavibacteria bacterium]HMQ99988.1 hypothetical protein [Ignavibacteria bacterium]
MKKPNVLLVLLMIFAAAGVYSQVSNNDKHIKFKKGESSATVAGSVVRGEEKTYVLEANKNQKMTVTLFSTEDNAVFRIKDRSSRYYLDGAGEIDDARKWEGTLPSDGEYKIIIGGTRGNTEYTLQVFIE